EATIPSTPTGTLMKKIQFQLMFSTMTPPTSGPIARARAETPAQIPMAWPRSFGGDVAVMDGNVAGVMGAAPTPRTRRGPRGRAGEREAGAGREPESEGRGREDDEADHEKPAPPIEVAELSTRDQERRERERIRDDDPLEARSRDVEILLHRRQRDVHHRVVE